MFNKTPHYFMGLSLRVDQLRDKIGVMNDSQDFILIARGNCFVKIY